LTRSASSLFDAASVWGTLADLSSHLSREEIPTSSAGQKSEFSKGNCDPN
jgi:hypothetical protein